MKKRNMISVRHTLQENVEAKGNAMLSSFAYNQMLTAIKRRADGV